MWGRKARGGVREAPARRRPARPIEQRPLPRRSSFSAHTPHTPHTAHTHLRARARHRRADGAANLWEGREERRGESSARGLLVGRALLRTPATKKKNGGSGAWQACVAPG